ncbi:MAG: NAD-dependent epimerase/dehydratase family protein [Bacillota bacterium]|nr:NAD-dependent epimerase/dehydratase family protein [Bacillota bacterium]
MTPAELERILTQPTETLVADLARLPGDIAVLGAGGKMGPTLARLAARACRAGGIDKRVYAVSRFGDRAGVEELEAAGVTVLRADLLKAEERAALPDFSNILYLAGRKFGTGADAALTWTMNATLPALVLERWPSARYVVFSSGNLYPAVDPAEGGCREEHPLGPVGEYAMSVLARERVFEHAATTQGTKVLLYRLNYAVALEYGVLCDLGTQVLAGTPIDLGMPLFNCIWQGDANRYALQSLLLASAPRPAVLNVTGPETLSVWQTALWLGEEFEREVLFASEPGPRALLSDAGRCFRHFGYPTVTVEQMLEWQAAWLLEGQPLLGKPTHFQETGGQF